MSFLVDPNTLFTAENIVFKERLDEVKYDDIPIFLMRDPNGDLAVSDRNQRGKKGSA